MKAYSTDLRQKIIDAYSRQEGSQRQLAKRFGVSLSFVQDLLRRYRKEGTIEPKPHAGGQCSKLSREQIALVAALLQEDDQAILTELCQRLEQRTGVRISRSTMGRLTRKLKQRSKRKV
jgi:transposase